MLDGLTMIPVLASDVVWNSGNSHNGQFAKLEMYLRDGGSLCRARHPAAGPTLGQPKPKSKAAHGRACSRFAFATGTPGSAKANGVWSCDIYGKQFGTFQAYGGHIGNAHKDERKKKKVRLGWYPLYAHQCRASVLVHFSWHERREAWRVFFSELHLSTRTLCLMVINPLVYFLMQILDETRSSAAPQVSCKRRCHFPTPSPLDSTLILTLYCSTPSTHAAHDYFRVCRYWITKHELHIRWGKEACRCTNLRQRAHQQATPCSVPHSTLCNMWRKVCTRSPNPLPLPRRFTWIFFTPTRSTTPITRSTANSAVSVRLISPCL